MNSISRSWIFNVLLYLLLNAMTPMRDLGAHIYAQQITNQMRHDHLADSTNEFLIDTSVVYGPAMDICRFPVVAFDGTNYLVAWDDYRGSIYCTRVSPSGEIIDPAGIPLSAFGHAHDEPAVAFDGMNYLVVWRDIDTDPGHGDISGTRISQAGAVLDPGGISICTMPYSQMAPSVTFGNMNFLVIWEDQFNSIYGARVSPGGTVLDPNGIIVAESGTCASVSFDGTCYLSVWCHMGISADIYAARIDQSGILLDSTAIIISDAPGGQSFPSVSFDGANYLVVWEDGRNGDSDLYGARVTPAGVVMDPDGFAVSTAASYQDLPRIAFDGTNYLAVWRDARGTGLDWDIYGARVTTTGVLLDTAGFPISTVEADQGYPSIAFGNTNYIVVWEDCRYAARRQTVGSRITQEGIVVDTSGLLISTAANDQHHPSASSDGTNYIVVWEDYRSFPSCEIYGRRVSESGAILDTASIAIANAVSNQRHPAVAYDGLNYFAVWEDSRPDYGIVGTRISQSGQIIDPGGIVIAAGGQWPSIAFDGSNYLVVYQKYQTSLGDNIYCSLITPGGVLLDSNKVISDALYNQENPRVVFGDANYLVVWQDHRNRSFYEDSIDIYGSRVNQSGVVLDTAGIVICRVQDDQVSPAVASNGVDYLAVWKDWRYGYAISGTRISQSGQVIDTALIMLSLYGYAPRVSFDGTYYLAVWEKYTTGTYGLDIYGARVDSTGVVVDSYPISTQLGSQRTPTLALGASNQMLVTFSGWTDSISNQPANTMRIWGKFYPFVGIEKERVLGLKETGLDLQVYPNPFSDLVQINYVSAKNAENIEFAIYDVSGRLIKELSLPSPAVGVQSSIAWNGTDQDNRQMASGIYFLVLRSGDYSTTRKLLLIR